MRPVSRRHSRRGLVGGSTFRRTPISRSPLDKTPKPGHLSELPPVNEVNMKGQFFRASFGKNPRFQIQLDKRPLSPLQYTGWLQSTGKKFDSSWDHSAQPISITLGQGKVIKRFDEGLMGMKQGGSRRIIIPAALGYRSTGS